MSDTLAARAADRFRRSFPGAAEPGVVFAPHRVDLMGSSTVAQQGMALLCADLRGVALALRPRADRALRQGSADQPPVDQRPLAEVADALRQRGLEVPGMDFVVVDGSDSGHSDTPLRVAAAVALLHLAGKELPRVELAKLCGDPKRPTSSADALALLSGRKDNCVHLDCRTWSHDLIALDPGYDFVIAEAGKVPLRPGRAELLADAVARLARYDPTITHLRDVKPEMIEDHFEQMPRDRSAGAVHVVDEIRRVGEAAAALRQGRMADFGRLLDESHASLRDDFDAVPRETDALARIACGQPGTAGARAIGSGTAVVALVEHASADRLRSALEHEFFRECGRKPIVTRLRPGAAASVLRECVRG